jgi:beta-lactamase regulating signal transducer with metallopeptidase domain
MTLLFDTPMLAALADALLHFLWQGAAIALACALVWRVTSSPAIRYGAGVTALALMLAAPIATTVAIGGARAGAMRADAAGDLGAGPGLAASAPLPIDGGPGGDTSALAPGTPDATMSASLAAQTGSRAGAAGRSTVSTIAARVLFVVWLAGVAVLSMRLAGGWLLARRLVTRDATPVGPDLAAIASRLAARLQIARAVRLLESRRVVVPVMVGWLKPVVLFPASALSGLTPSQVEALLAHELAHVRRHDYLVNLLQTCVETLLFYHPAVWWISAGVRREREHCCDDLAVGVCDRLTYATALGDLAALVATPRVAALAATDGSVVDRVRRILGEPGAEARPGVAAIATLVLVVAGGALVVPEVLARPNAEAPAQGIESAPAPATAPQVTAATAVAGGVPGGVPGGVAGGVPGGVAGGVPGGVTAGVSGGVTGGVPAGLSAGVSAAVPVGARAEVPAPEQTTARVPEAAVTERMRQLIAADIDAELKFLQQQYELERARAQAELQQTDMRGRLELQQAQAQLEALKRELADARARVDAGVAPRDVIATIEQQIRHAESAIQMAQSDRASSERMLDLRLMEAEQRMMHERQKLELARAQRELELQARRLLNESASERQQADLQAKLDELARRLERQQRLESRGLSADDLPDADDQARPIRAGDHVGVVIAGEPDLPRIYLVEAGGTIRLPLLGTVRVDGRTTSQVQEEIARVLRARGFQSAPVVRVTLMR